MITEDWTDRSFSVKFYKRREKRWRFCYSTISVYHKQSVKTGTKCTVGILGICAEASADTPFCYLIDGLSHFPFPQFYPSSSTSTTITYRGGNAAGQTWEDGRSIQQFSQRPALYKLDSYNRYYGSNNIQRKGERKMRAGIRLLWRGLGFRCKVGFG